MRENDELRRESNVHLARQLYARFAKRDIPGILQLLSEDVDWLFHGPEDIPFAGHFHGHLQVAGFFGRALENTEFLVFEPREFIAGASSVLVQGLERARSKPSGRIWETEWAHVFSMENSKIIKMREYYDTAVIAAAFRGQ